MNRKTRQENRLVDAHNQSERRYLGRKARKLKKENECRYHVDSDCVKSDFVWVCGSIITWCSYFVSPFGSSKTNVNGLHEAQKSSNSVNKSNAGQKKKSDSPKIEGKTKHMALRVVYISENIFQWAKESFKLKYVNTWPLRI